MTRIRYIQNVFPVVTEHAMDREPECTPNEEVKGVVTEKETKMCIRCHHLKPIDVFEKKKRELNYRNICRNCRCNSARVRTVLRRKHIKRHGLPSGKCAICDKRNLVFDHCHSSQCDYLTKPI